MKFRSIGDSTSSRVKDKLKTINLCSKWIEYKRVTIVNFRMNVRSSNGAGSSLINSIQIRLGSRILWKHDLETAETCCGNDRFLSTMTPRLRAESTGERMKLLGR